MTTYAEMADNPAVCAEARRRAPACDRCGERMRVNSTRLRQISYSCYCGRIVSGDYWSQVARDIGEPSTADQLHGPAEQRGPRPERSNPTVEAKGAPVSRSDDLPPNFSHWEQAGARGAPTGFRLAVDKDGRFWRLFPDAGWRTPEEGVMSQEQEQRHRAANRKEPAMNATAGAPSSGTPTSSEVTGIRSAVARLEEIAKTHEQIGTGEGFLGSLNRMEVGDEDKQLYRDAQEASRNAGRLWAHAASEVRAHNLPVSEAYSVSPGAGNKQANTNE